MPDHAPPSPPPPSPPPSPPSPTSPRRGAPQRPRQASQGPHQPSQSDSPPPPPPAPPLNLELKASADFPRWLHDAGLSLAFTTYQTGKLFFVGLKSDGSLSVYERSFKRAMGLWADGQALWLATLYQLWRFENHLPPGELAGPGFDRKYVPQLGYTTGAVDAHDVALCGDGQPIFVNTRFSCLARPSAQHSFIPIWKPPFIKELAREDRCHLNGLAMRDGAPAFATACGQTNAHEGWRDQRDHGGCVMDIDANEVITTGLSMPHSPRWYRDRLWLFNSGRGDFGFIDPKTHRFEPVAFCPGYARGLAFHGHHAIIALSLGRERERFGGLAIDDRLQHLKVKPQCGLLIVNIETGHLDHWVRIEGAVRELYDVVALAGVRQPMAVGFKTNQIRHAIHFPPLESQPQHCDSLETV